jgi:hypothetical protein
MDFTRFDFWGNGDFDEEHVPFPGVTPQSIVVGSITEIDADGLPFVGQATIELHNVAPRDGVVDIVAAIRWDTSLRTRVSLVSFP